MLRRITYPTAPAGIDPQPVVHVMIIKMMIATIVKNTFHPVLSSDDEVLLEVLLDELLELEELIFDDEPPPILLRLTASPNSLITNSGCSSFLFPWLRKWACPLSST